MTDNPSGLYKHIAGNSDPPCVYIPTFNYYRMMNTRKEKRDEKSGKIDPNEGGENNTLCHGRDKDNKAGKTGPTT